MEVMDEMNFLKQAQSPPFASPSPPPAVPLAIAIDSCAEIDENEGLQESSALFAAALASVSGNANDQSHDKRINLGVSNSKALLCRQGTIGGTYDETDDTCSPILCSSTGSNGSNLASLSYDNNSYSSQSFQSDINNGAGSSDGGEDASAAAATTSTTTLDIASTGSYDTEGYGYFGALDMVMTYDPRGRIFGADGSLTPDSVWKEHLEFLARVPQQHY